MVAYFQAKLFRVFWLGLVSTALLPILPAAAQETPWHQNVQRIEFAPNATSASLENTNLYAPTHYVLTANGGQMMNVMVDSANPNVQFTVTGADGTVLGTAPDHGTVAAVLPATQDYYIDVMRPPGAAYGLSVTIPETIQFAPGAVSDLVNNTLAPHSSHAYILNASAGQSMSVDVDAPVTANGPAATLTAYGLDGTVLTNGNMSGSSRYQGLLPRSEDYELVVNNTSSYPVHYSMNVDIQ